MEASKSGNLSDYSDDYVHIVVVMLTPVSCVVNVVMVVNVANVVICWCKSIRT